MKSLIKRRVDIRQVALVAMILLLMLLVIGVYHQNVAALVPGVNTMVSVNNTGDGQGGNDHAPLGDSFNISADGRYVSFSSRASNLVSSDTNSYADIFVRDLDSNTTSRVSTSASGVQSNNNSGIYGSGGQAISETGRYIAFSSFASNLIDGQTITSTFPQIYLRDTLTNTISVVTQKTDGTLGNASTAIVHQVSNDGRFVLWEGQKNTNLNPGGSTATPSSHLYLADLSTRTFTLLSPQDGSGSVVMGGAPAMNCDGSFIVVSTSAQLDVADTDSVYDTYMIDVRNGSKVTNLTSLSNMHTLRPSISCNGNYIAFLSQDTVYSSLVPSGNIRDHLYLYDRINETISLVDATTSGTLGNSYAAGQAGVDNKGNVVFSSVSTNFGAYPAQPQFYLKNKAIGSLEIVSRTMANPNTASNGVIGDASISADGKKVVYRTGPTASSLYSPVAYPWTGYDANGKSDLVMSLTGL